MHIMLLLLTNNFHDSFFSSLAGPFTPGSLNSNVTEGMEDHPSTTQESKTNQFIIRGCVDVKNCPRHKSENLTVCFIHLHEPGRKVLNTPGPVQLYKLNIAFER